LSSERAIRSAIAPPTSFVPFFSSSHSLVPLLAPRNRPPIHRLKPHQTSYSADVTYHFAKPRCAPKFPTAVLVGQSRSCPILNISLFVRPVFSPLVIALSTLQYHTTLVRRHWQPTATSQRAHIGRSGQLLSIHFGEHRPLVMHSYAELQQEVP
jgi:hypothetical protein